MLKRHLLSIKLLCFIAAALCASATQAAGEPQKKEAVRIVDAAVEMGKNSGTEAMLAEINNPKGRFIKGEIYAFAYDISAGKVVAHPLKKDVIGKTVITHADVDGKLYRKAIIDGAVSKGSGWEDYVSKNPANGAFEHKTVYYKRAGDYVVGAGVYR